MEKEKTTSRVKGREDGEWPVAVAALEVLQTHHPLRHQPFRFHPLRSERQPRSAHVLRSRQPAPPWPLARVNADAAMGRSEHQTLLLRHGLLPAQLHLPYRPQQQIPSFSSAVVTNSCRRLILQLYSQTI